MNRARQHKTATTDPVELTDTALDQAAGRRAQHLNRTPAD